MDEHIKNGGEVGGFIWIMEVEKPELVNIYRKIKNLVRDVGPRWFCRWIVPNLWEINFTTTLLSCVEHFLIPLLRVI